MIGDLILLEPGSMLSNWESSYPGALSSVVGESGYPGLLSSVVSEPFFFISSFLCFFFSFFFCFVLAFFQKFPSK